jgi:Protein of unknown function (DUF3887)
MVDEVSGESTEAAQRGSLALALERNAEAVAGRLRSPGESADALEALLCARTLADASEDATRLLVADARAAGRTWQEIGQLLSVSRQAAQQRFRARAGEEQVEGAAALKRRATEIVEQIAAGDLEGASVDWDQTLREKLTHEALAEAWQQVSAGTGGLERIGRPSVTRRGPYRVADVPLSFEHGPMKARITFNHDATIGGLFILLPDAP